MPFKKSPRMFSLDGVMFVDLGAMEIWDGADLSLLRDSLHRLVRLQKQRAIGVDMSHVKYIPSGFFGMLFDWHEEGVHIRLRSPQPNVQKMLWFSRFFAPVNEVCYELKSNVQPLALPGLTINPHPGPWTSTKSKPLTPQSPASLASHPTQTVTAQDS